MHEHDRGLGYDMRIMSRRRAMFFLGAAGAAAVTAGCAAGADSGAADGVTTAEASAPTTTGAVAPAAPQETAGPYPGDGSNGPNVLIRTGVVRSDITTSFGGATGVAEGVPLKLTLSLQDLVKDGAAGAGMAVYVWHCDREGRYSLYSEGVTEENYLRGVQVADAAGAVTFTSIFPACYEGRWPHIHFEVYDSLESAVAGGDARLTSQIAMPEDTCDAVFAYDSGYARSIDNISRVSLESDMVFGDGWDAELATVTGTPSQGLTATLTIGVADRSQNTMAPGAPAGPPPGFDGTPPQGFPPGGFPSGGMPPGR
ncbi:dioxygenase family protein [Nocardia higoensis]|uniref:dioxygenase family protein n=1 Tax=Nocardia higoensis TaxID=228599 RepID=UPI0002D4752E|nr:dioxygenase [Nocardia higoensis]